MKQPTFERNQEYIDRLIKHSLMTKAGGKTSEYEENRKRLSELERKMSSNDIIQNTKLAFDK